MIIKITDDFNLEKIADSGQNFRARYENNNWVFLTGDNILHIRKLSENEYDTDTDANTWEKVWYPYFDLGRSYKKIRESIKNDDYLKDASEKGKGIRILLQDPWEMIVTFIISQRKNIPAIRKSVEMICQLFGKKREGYYLFPDAESILNAGEEGLSSCSLGYRTPYILDAAKQSVEKSVDPYSLGNLNDEDLFLKLKEIKGVGDKVSNCICLFGYGRCGRAPIDVWISRVIENEYAGENPFPKYGDVAGIMQQYMFFAARY